MVHSKKEVLDWLLEHCQHDRVLYNALTNHSAEPAIARNDTDKVWMVDATMPRSGRRIWVIVVPHSVTGEPHHYYRYKEWDREVRGYGLNEVSVPDGN